MGKLFVKLGNWITKQWIKFSCFHNAILLKLMIKVGDCPNKICTCKK